MERNVRLYRHYQTARSLAFWLPVFFLYFSAHLPADRVLWLEALYYVAVVTLEVPSGYLSDRFGRRPTLVLAGLAWVVGYGLLASATSQLGFAAGQLLIAAGMAFNSGTDSALLYDSLAACGRHEAFAEHEARAQSRGLLAMGASALVGGLVASVDLRLGHLLSAGGATVTLGLALAMREPPATALAHTPWRQLREVAAAIRRPGLAWVFAFAVAMTVFNHVPYELAQPYLAQVLDEPGGAGVTPVASGVMMALMMTTAAAASRVSVALAARLGPGAVLLGAMLLQGIVIGSLARWLHPAVLVVLMLRSVPGALAGPIQLGLVLPRLDARVRATYSSVQSLAGRLAFAGVLWVAAGAVGGLERLDHAAIATLGTGACALLGVVFVGLLVRVRSLDVSGSAGPVVDGRA